MSKFFRRVPQKPPSFHIIAVTKAAQGPSLSKKEERPS